MEEGPSPSSIILDGKITGIVFSLATRQEICKSSISDCPINHASQLSNPFLGLPLDIGKCESCGTSETGQCEGHFGYIELPIPIYHPDHVGELKRILTLLCLKCLKLKTRKVQTKNVGVLERMLSSCCKETSQVTLNEVKTTDGASFLELKLPSRTAGERPWNFLQRFGFRYGDGNTRILLPSEVMEILKKIPADTRKKLAAKGHVPQEGYILQYLPVPPNCLSVPDVSDGVTTMSKDYSITLLKKVLKQIEIIKSSRSGMPNFESHHIEANDLQAAVAQYFQFRGTGKAARDVDPRFGVSKESNTSSAKAWLEKMKTLFIRKGSGFSSRSVITGDPYRGVNEIGLPSEIAQRITFEERVNQHNMGFLQKLVDMKLCLTYRDGSSAYSLREGSKGHTFLRHGQVVHRRIMDGDIVFINRPPTTHKHSLQALSVYIHEDHTVKINPLICSPLSADFDGDCIHLFYPQSLAARAEVLELFSVEKQLLSSHTGNFNLQIVTDSLLSLKLMFKRHFFARARAEQLAMFVPTSLGMPTVFKNFSSRPFWTALQILQTVLPVSFDCSGEKYMICKGKFMNIDFSMDAVQSVFIDIVTSILLSKGPKEVLEFFNSLTPLLMENLYMEGSSVCLEDFYVPKTAILDLQEKLQNKNASSALKHIRATQSESMQFQLDTYLRGMKQIISKFVLESSGMGLLIDSRSDSAVNKVVQQIGFLGVQLSSKGKFYTETLVKEVAELFQRKYPSDFRYPCEEFGLVRSCLFYGLDPFQEMVHSISSREVIVRSSRGLTEPGTLFKNLMAILRDVVVCYDGTIRNVCSNSIVQFQYGFNHGMSNAEFGSGEPVGVLAVTAMSNPAYKAVLDSSPSSNSSWGMMKEILLCPVNFKNDTCDRRVLLYLNDCVCGRKYCRENASCVVKDQLMKLSLKDVAVELLIEYGQDQSVNESSEAVTGLIGHIHLNERLLKSSAISMNDVRAKCDDRINSFRKKKKVGFLFKKLVLAESDSCHFEHSSKSNSTGVPCLRFIWLDTSDDQFEWVTHKLADTICPVLLGTIIKGDPRISTVNIVWINPDSPTWIRSPSKGQKAELALDVAVEKDAIKKTGDAWRTVMDSCLPVLHLIDTRRSIPYAIKQVEQLLGISCAFEQAVQRLSTSVMMVTKGVLKDHLVLLANSMTCSGNLIGFNMGGIKALSRSLNMQVPFTEATLSAPRKCFERAAEKCHVDNLSSVVASCSWGKQVAIELNQSGGGDVYDFLHLVRSSLNGEETSTACIGADLHLEDEYMDIDLSPLRDSEKPTFEETIEFDDNRVESGSWDAPATSQSNGSWEKAAGNDGNNGGGWETAGKDGWKQSGSSSTWGKKVHGTDHDSSSDAKPFGVLEEVIEKGGNEGSSQAIVDWDKATDNSSQSQSVSLSLWGKRSNDNDGSSASNVRPSVWERAGDGNRNDQPTQSSGGWDKAVDKSGCNQSGSVSVWGKKVDSIGRDSPSLAKPVITWGKAVENDVNNIRAGTQESSLSDHTRPTGDWEKAGDKIRNDEPTQSSGAWDMVTDKSGCSQAGSLSVWGKKADSTGHDSPSNAKPVGTWEKAANNNGNSNRVGTQVSSWGSCRKGEEAVVLPRSFQDDSPDVNECSGKEHGFSSVNESSSSPWSAKEHETSGSKQSGTSSSWGKKALSQEGWNKTVEFDAVQNSEGSLSKSWQDANSKNMGNADGKNRGNWQTDMKAQRGPRRNFGGRGDLNPSNNGEWKNSRNRLAQPVDNASGGGAFTKTRQRLDLFTLEEQEILSDIEPIMENIRKIMNQNGYNDGDPLSAEDQSYIVDNVLNHHPDKTLKIGAGINYVMVSKHGTFQESRCFYVVSTDELKQDFSFRKSLENYISGKYADKAETFIAKYFKKPQPRPGPGWVRGGGSTPDGAGTPREPRRGWTRAWKDANTGPDEAGTPREQPRAQPVDNASGGGAFTKTRQRLDLFTLEEQEILSDIEPIMENIRKIMNQNGYNDGDPLSAEDQSYIVDNVLNHHPDKTLKIGAGINYVMVSKHGTFQESRCFYVVSTDELKQDFSFRKSLENYISGKYADKAETFIAKYFKKPQPRPGPGWVRGGGSTPDGAGTPREPRRGWTRAWKDANTGPDEAGTPREQPRAQPVDNASGGGAFTKTRQRLDLFTLEEQEILSDIEPIMENIRKIMNQNGYNDGDPLSAEDQSYIVDNVLNHHPDKTLKIGAGINYVMVSKHGTFQESRCFYVVSTDELKQDFSFRKSLENYISGKYADKAETFIAKYFKKPQPRPGPGWVRGGGST